MVQTSVNGDVHDETEKVMSGIWTRLLSAQDGSKEGLSYSITSTWIMDHVDARLDDEIFKNYYDLLDTTIHYHQIIRRLK